MPSARIHEVIARKINQDYNMDDTLLRLGTISPDSWRNSGAKDKYLSHFWNFDIKEGEANDYERFYIKYHDDINNPFYFGYLLHLMVDQYWKSIVNKNYFVNINGVSNCILKDGSLKEDKEHFSYYESLKIQKRLFKDFNLTILPTNIEDVPNLECNIEELDLSGLFGPNGSINYINTKVVPNGEDEELLLYDYNDILKYIDETTEFVKSELNRLSQLEIRKETR